MAHLFLILLIVATIVTFYIQNEVPGMVSFLIWNFEISFGSIAVAAMLAGVMLMQVLTGMRAKNRANTRKNLDFLARRSRW